LIRLAADLRSPSAIEHLRGRFLEITYPHGPSHLFEARERLRAHIEHHVCKDRLPHGAQVRPRLSKQAFDLACRIGHVIVKHEHDLIISERHRIEIAPDAHGQDAARIPIRAAA
jgi:hypothetical protein